MRRYKRRWRGRRRPRCADTCCSGHCGRRDSCAQTVPVSPRPARDLGDLHQWGASPPSFLMMRTRLNARGQPVVANTNHEHHGGAQAQHKRAPARTARLHHPDLRGGVPRFDHTGPTACKGCLLQRNWGDSALMHRETMGGRAREATNPSLVRRTSAATPKI